MSFTSVLIAILSVTTSLPAWSSTFGNMEGTYKILSCRNDGGSPSREDKNLCDYTQLTVRPESYATAIYFSNGIQNSPYVRSFGLPKNMKDSPNGRYVERGDFYASYTNDSRDLGEVFILQRIKAGPYKLSLHRRSDVFQTFDVFEMELQKISDHSEPLPPYGEPEKRLIQRRLKSSPTGGNNNRCHQGKNQNIK